MTLREPGRCRAWARNGQLRRSRASSHSRLVGIWRLRVVHRPILPRIAGRGSDRIFVRLRVCNGRLARLNRLRVRRRNRFFCHAPATTRRLFAFPVLGSSPAVGRSRGSRPCDRTAQCGRCRTLGGRTDTRSLPLRIVAHPLGRPVGDPVASLVVRFELVDMLGGAVRPMNFYAPPTSIR